MKFRQAKKIVSRSYAQIGKRNTANPRLGTARKAFEKIIRSDRKS